MSVKEPGASPGFLLWHATLRWQRELASVLRPLDLTHVQFVLLASTWWLNRSGKQPTQIRVARQAGTDVKMTSQVLRTLERKGLIVREDDLDDTRAKRVRATDRGGRLAREAIAVVEAADAAFFAPVSEQEVVGLLAHLARSPFGPDDNRRAEAR